MAPSKAGDSGSPLWLGIRHHERRPPLLPCVAIHRLKWDASALRSSLIPGLLRMHQRVSLVAPRGRGVL